MKKQSRAITCDELQEHQSALCNTEKGATTVKSYFNPKEFYDLDRIRKELAEGKLNPQPVHCTPSDILTLIIDHNFQYDNDSISVGDDSNLDLKWILILSKRSEVDDILLIDDNGNGLVLLDGCHRL